MLLMHCVRVFVVCILVQSSDAALGTQWTVPVINSISGTGTVTNAVSEDANTFPQLAAAGATNYDISSQEPAGTFQINAGDGTLSLAAGRAVDYEIAHQHVLVVEVDDSSTTGTATITINISDINDNPPAFPSAGYSTCVISGTAAGASVTTVTPTDADTTTADNTISAMSIIAGDSNSDFAISTAGAITTAKTVSMATLTGYALQVEAADSDSGTMLTGTTTVYVIVSSTCACGAAAITAGLLSVFVAMLTMLY